jgi:hypothetical protein
LKSFDQIADDLLHIEGFLYPQLKLIAANLMSDYPVACLEPSTVPLQPLPSAPLSVTVALDIGEPWWKLWFATKPSPQQQADHVRTLISYECAAVAEELAHLAESRLTERVEHTLQRLAVISDGVRTQIERRKTLLDTEYGGDERSLRELENDLSKRAQACVDTHAACALFSEELTQLIEILGSGTEETQTLQRAMEPAGT